MLVFLLRRGSVSAEVVSKKYLNGILGSYGHSEEQI